MRKSTSDVQAKMTREDLVKAFRKMQQRIAVLHQDLVSTKEIYLSDSILEKHWARMDSKFSEDERSLKISIRSLDLLISDTEQLVEPLRREDYVEIGRRFMVIAKAFRHHSKVALDFYQELKQIDKELLEQYRDVDDSCDSDKDDDWDGDRIDQDDDDDRRS